MKEFFEALNNFKAPIEKDYFVLVDREQIIALEREPSSQNKKISRDNFKILLDNGIEYFLYKNGKFIRKPPKSTERTYPVLKKDTTGYIVHEGDPYWPTEITEGGYTWQTPSE
jgi:hypothetical protein